MRTMRAFGVLTIGLGWTGIALMSGCFHYEDDCLAAHNCPSSDSGPPPDCDPSQTSNPVADTCGVFISPAGNDGNAGTKEKPLKSIKAALAKGSTIYACAGTTPYVESVTIGKAATLFGALDCTSWVYSASKKTQITAAADAVPLKLVSTASGTELHDFTISAADAMAMGASSIAVLDDHADVTLDNVDLVAGGGAAGAPGSAQEKVMTPATADGSNGADDAMCNVPGVLGGAGGKNTCGMVDTSGGLGGSGAAANTGGDGSGGQPAGMTSNGGSGQTKTVACNASDPKGVPGSVGPAGTGARGIGNVSGSGYKGPLGVLGMAGGPGQGGGGGGGARQCDANGMFAGPSGGGGGAGGCGGAPGSAGQSGGSSIGVLALGAKLTLMTVRITTHDGGAGGLGGDGQPGGDGGLAGHATGSAACDGGKGGQGGAGGPGGGGAGGHSVAIAINGGALPELSTTTIANGKGAAGGSGGDMDMTTQTRGDAGLACRTLDFTNPLSPSACAM